DSAGSQARFMVGAKGDPYRAAGTVDLRVVNTAGASHAVQMTMNTNEEKEFEFPSSLIGDDGALQVQARTADADGLLASSAAWMTLYEKTMLFELAFARGLLLILVQSLIVLSITLMSSTFLSAPLSIL